MDHAVLRELTAGAALDDLDPAERAELGAHIAACDGCVALANDLGDVLADLALVAPELRPPATLQRDLLAAIRAESSVAPAFTSVGGREPVDLAARRAAPRGAVSRVPAWAGLAAAAVLAVVAAGLGVRASQLGSELETTRAELAAEQAIVAIAADPAHQTASLTATAGPAAAVLYVPGTDDAWLVSHNLPATPEGRVYQLWHADASGVHPLGTYRHDGRGTFIAPFGIDLSDSDAAMVTLEPEGGATGQPGDDVVFGEL